MNDLIVLEKAVGKKTIADLQNGQVSFEAQKAIIWLKLRDHIPDLDLDLSWDIPLSALTAAMAEPAADDSEPAPCRDCEEAQLVPGVRPQPPRHLPRGHLSSVPCSSPGNLLYKL